MSPVEMILEQFLLGFFFLAVFLGHSGSSLRNGSSSALTSGFFGVSVSTGVSDLMHR